MGEKRITEEEEERKREGKWRKEKVGGRKIRRVREEGGNEERGKLRRKEQMGNLRIYNFKMIMLVLVFRLPIYIIFSTANTVVNLNSLVL